ncbi:SLATT domain-containing protein [Saccharopolyspora sp. NPDC002376]
MREIPSGDDADYPAAVEAYVLRLHRFYDWRARWHRRFYRSSGIMLILIGAGMPVLAGFDYPGKPLLLSVAGFVIAGLTALRSFYSWDQSWVLLRSAERAIGHAYLTWRGTEAWSSGSPGGQSDHDRRRAALRLLEKVVEIQENEAEAYFKGLAWPHPDGAHHATERLRPVDAVKLERSVEPVGSDE